MEPDDGGYEFFIIHVGCHMATGDPNDFIYCEANWVAGDLN